jgi:hypothetical protein
MIFYRDDGYEANKNREADATATGGNAIHDRELAERDPVAPEPFDGLADDRAEAARMGVDMVDRPS